MAALLNTTPKHNQLPLNLYAIKQDEINGVQMGVLSDGNPYLTARGLARMCGVEHSSIIRLANNWTEERHKERGRKIAELLAVHGHRIDGLYIRVELAGVETHAYTDAACMALLEYYAFDSAQGANEIAVRNYRLLARLQFRAFIYDQLGYNPDRHIPDSWKNFHERVLINDQVPTGYFSIFREIADMVVHMIRAGCPLDDHTVPDCSVGTIWARFWTDNRLALKYGERQRCPHNYPNWFPQSLANPVPVWIYPIEALGIFRRWLYENYVPVNFPKYLNTKVKENVFLPARAEMLLVALSHKDIAAASLPPRQAPRQPDMPDVGAPLKPHVPATDEVAREHFRRMRDALKKQAEG